MLLFLFSFFADAFHLDINSEKSYINPKIKFSSQIKEAPIISNISRVDNLISLALGCSLDHGNIKLYHTCSTCTVKDNIWINIIFENNDIFDVEYLEGTIYSPSYDTKHFISRDKITYNKETNVLSYDTGSSNIKLSETQTENNLQCIIPATPSPSLAYINSSISDNNREKNLISLRFDCFVDRGNIKLYHTCSTCTVKNNIWINIIFENNDIFDVEYLEGTIYSPSYDTKHFISRDKITYNKETNVLSYDTGSSNIKLSETQTENNLQCIIPATFTPTQTPVATPSPSLAYTNSTISDSNREKNLISLRFDCFVDRGNIKLYHTCSTCTVKNNIWINIIFENNDIFDVEYLEGTIYSPSYDTKHFISRDKITYNKETNVLSYDTGSSNIKLSETQTENNLQCIIPATFTPTQTPVATPSPSLAYTNSTISDSNREKNLISLRFDCFVDRGNIKLYHTCSTCTVKNNIWINIIFENNDIFDVEYLEGTIYSPSYDTKYFISRDKITYNKETNVLSYDTGSSNIKLSETQTENNLQCIIPATFTPTQTPVATPSPSLAYTNSTISDSNREKNLISLRFDCFVDRGNIKLYHTCSTCTVKNNIWINIIFENNDIFDVEYLEGTIYSPSYDTKYFISRDKITYNKETNVLSYDTGSSNIKLSETQTENNLQCIIPATPSPSLAYINSSISDNNREKNLISLRFDCFVDRGNIKLYHTCSTCTVKNNIWINIIFENNDIFDVEYLEGTIYSPSYDTKHFISRDKITYNKETNVLSYDTGSSNIKLSETQTENNLQCIIPATFTPTQTPVATPSPSLAYTNSTISDSNREKNLISLRFDCFVDRGNIKLYHTCSTCTVKNNIWINIIFENNDIFDVEYLEGTIYSPSYDTKYFISRDKITYNKETNVLSYDTGSSNIKLSETQTENNLQCIIPATFTPTQTPVATPSPSLAYTNSTISDSNREKNLISLRFDCFVDRGNIKLYHTCSTCTVKNNIWINIIFENNDIFDVEYLEGTIYSPSYDTKHFISRDKITYNKETNVLSYDTGSSNIKLSETQTENNLQCIIPATQSPTVSQSPTPFPTPTLPNEPSEIVFGSTNETENKGNLRCVKIMKPENEQERNVVVNVVVSEFKELENDNGGAIHLINCGINCDKTVFTLCKSINGGGGAVYVHNSQDLLNDVILKGLTFDRCEALFGGGIYVYSTFELNIVKINSCRFIETSSLSTSNDDLSGGNAIYINVKLGSITRCSFKECKGNGGSVKIINNFEANNNQNALSFLNYHFDDVQKSLLIDDCFFEINDNSKSSIYYVNGKSGSLLKVKNCIFAGKLSNGNYFIDGKSIDNNPSKLFINHCKFSSDYSHALNVSPKDKHIIIDLKNSVFSNDNEKIKKLCSLKFICAGVVTILAIIIAVIMVIVIKNRANEEMKEETLEQFDEPIILSLI